MTDAQNDALRRIVDIMREHFDSGIVTVIAEDDESTEGDDEIHCGWHGGYANAYGLLELGKLQMLNERKQNYGREQPGL